MRYLFNWYVKVYRRLQDSKIASLKDSLQKAKEKLQTQEVPKAKDSKTDMTPRAPLHSPLPDCSPSTHSLSRLPFHFEETIKQLPFKVKPPQVTGNPSRYLSLLGQRAN